MAVTDEWIPRREGEATKSPITVYHGGYIHHTESFYVGGTISYYDGVDKEKMSMSEIDRMVKGLNSSYVGSRIHYWYSFGAETDAMIKMDNDEDTILMCCCVPELRLVILYLDHLELDPDYNEGDDCFLKEDFEYEHPAFGLVSSAKVLRKALKHKAIVDGWEIAYLKNDNDRVRAICKAENCDFELYASKMQHEPTLQIKTYQPEHNCVRVIDSVMIKTPYLVMRFTNHIHLNPGISIESLQQAMAATLRAHVSYQQAYRTKRRALDLLEANMREHFARVQDYAREMKRVDPDTTLDIRCDFDNPEKQPIFKMTYVCLGALKRGYKAGCRPIVGLDGCHLKSRYGGILLTAVGLDGDKSTWVIAYAIVEMETKDYCIWFLELLMRDLNITGEGNGFTIISDKEKGLIPAAEYLLPLADHRFCVRHLWTNFNGSFPGKEKKDQLWAIAKSTTMTYYHKEMMTMNQIDPLAHLWLMHPDKNPRHWCMVHFHTFLKCDVLLNNMCESFNAFILSARTKEVITMFEEIRIKLMKRIAMRKEKVSKWKDTICPKPRLILEKNKVKSSTDCLPFGTGRHLIEIESIRGSRRVVDLRRRTCACRR